MSVNAIEKYLLQEGYKTRNPDTKCWIKYYPEFDCHDLKGYVTISKWAEEHLYDITKPVYYLRNYSTDNRPEKYYQLLFKGYLETVDDLKYILKLLRL